MKRIIFTNFVFIALFLGLALPSYAATKSLGKKKPVSTQADYKKLDALVDKGHKGDQGIKGISFNFPNAKLSVFAEFIAELSEKILIGEELLKDTVNIKSEEKLNFDELKSLFNALLFSHGLDVVEDDLYMQIIRRADSFVKVYKLNYLKSADVAKSLTEMFRMSFRVGNTTQSIQISSVDDANALIVLAPKEQQIEIKRTIKKMDVRKRQVLLNILIVELTKRSEFGFGVDFKFDDGEHTVAVKSGGTSSGSTDPMKFTTLGVESAGGVRYDHGNWFFNVQGVDNDTKVKTLSQPRILAADNQKAEIKIGRKEPYVTTSVSGIGGDDPQQPTTNSTISSTISTEDIGTNIQITPRINSLNDVTLITKLTIRNIVDQLKIQNGKTGTGSNQTTNFNFIPQVGHRTVNNTSNVMSGEVLAIGGLLKSQKISTSTAPPLLGDIPLIGWIFSKKSEAYEQTELMIFICPSVVNNPIETRTVTKKETDKLRYYDKSETVMIDGMLERKKSLNDDVFSVFDYFTNGKYRTEQDFVPQPGRL